jgi:hypothetical protein
MAMPPGPTLMSKNDVYIHRIRRTYDALVIGDAGVAKEKVFGLGRDQAERLMGRVNRGAAISRLRAEACFS